MISRLLVDNGDDECASIERWLGYNFVKAQQIARQQLLETVDGEYVFSGRFSDCSRNVRRTMDEINGFYGDGGPLRRQMDIKDPKDIRGLFLPMKCFDMFVKEIKSAAYGEYYYRYEKRYD